MHLMSILFSITLTRRIWIPHVIYRLRDISRSTWKRVFLCLFHLRVFFSSIGRMVLPSPTPAPLFNRKTWLVISMRAITAAQQALGGVMTQMGRGQQPGVLPKHSGSLSPLLGRGAPKLLCAPRKGGKGMSCFQLAFNLPVASELGALADSAQSERQPSSYRGPAADDWGERECANSNWVWVVLITS